MSVQLVLVVKTIVQVYWSTSNVMIILEIQSYFNRIRALDYQFLVATGEESNKQ